MLKDPFKMLAISERFSLVTGNAEGITPLNALDSALIKSGIGNTNLIKVTSIIPPGAKYVKVLKIKPGMLLACAYTYITSDILGEVISASICVALPQDKDQPGLIMEFSHTGKKSQAEEIVKEMAYEGMRLRKQKIKKIIVKSSEHKVKKIGCAFAGVVLWP